MTARCPRCDRPDCRVAIPGDWRPLPNGGWGIWREDEGFDPRYTTYFCAGETVDWRARALAAEAEVVRLRKALCRPVSWTSWDGTGDPVDYECLACGATWTPPGCARHRPGCPVTCEGGSP